MTAKLRTRPPHENRSENDDSSIMKLWRTMTWVLALTLTSLPLAADRHQALEALCQEQAASGQPPCHLQPCPCGPGQITLKRGESGLCACRSAPEARRHTRLKAVARCNEHRQNKRQSCFVSRGDCPNGFEALERFSDPLGNRFTACRDNRHEQTGRELASAQRLVGQDLMSQYRQLISHLEAKRIGQPAVLSAQTRESLRDAFPGNSVNRLSLIRTQALSQGCFADCERIFCADDGQIERWSRNQNPVIGRELLHQIVHAVHCEREGGREGYVRRWFQHLPDDVHSRLQADLALDAEQIHYAMYMETHAANRATALCRRLTGCDSATDP